MTKKDDISSKGNVCTDKGNVCTDKGNVIDDKKDDISSKGNVCTDKGNVCTDKGNICTDKENVCTDKENVCKDKEIKHSEDDKNNTSSKGEYKTDDIKKDSSEGFVFKNKKLEDMIKKDEIVVLSTYFPLNCGIKDQWSEQIIMNGLKNHRKLENDLAYEYLEWSEKNFAKIKPYLVKLVARVLSNSKFLVIPFPSSKQCNPSHGITNFVIDLVKENSNWENGTKYLQRALDGGISVVDKQKKIEDRNILLIDDVVTTGKSFKDGRELLQKNTAGKVFCFAIAKTWNKRILFELSEASNELHKILKKDSNHLSMYMKNWKLINSFLHPIFKC